MGLNDWNWRLAADPQNLAWDCAACSIAWCLRTIGRSETEYDVIRGLGPERISSTYGLLDASGAGLVQYLGELGIPAASNPEASFEEVLDAAGYQPMAIGGRKWCHWSAVRMGTQAIGRDDFRMLALMNPSSGYMGIEQTMEEYEFNDLGSFSAVWFVSW